MLATITVTNALNVANGDTTSIATLTAGGGDGGDGISLREAIIAANNTANSPVGTPDVINFAIPGAGPHVIDVSSGGGALPSITDAVTINGYSENTDGASSANTAAITAAINATILIVLDGNGLNAHGLTIVPGGDGSTIRGLNIQDFDGAGIQISGSDNNTVAGNFIGTNTAGNAAAGNIDGVVIAGASSGNTIGGTAAADRNLISGNTGDGVEVSGMLATGNTILGNFIGVDVTGAVDLGNSDHGIEINDAPSNTIGGTTTASRNIISGNNDDGVFIEGTDASGNMVLGNFIGTDLSGTADLGNSQDGVFVGNAPNNTVGGTTVGARNIVSGNGIAGVEFAGNDATGNTVLGNYIGTDVTGSAALGNDGDGVLINEAPGNTVGGTATGARNVISGNSGSGVLIVGDAADGNMVEGNYIGTNAAGTADLGNTEHGVHIDEADNNTIGGSAANAGNLISGNDIHGVLIEGDPVESENATGNMVLGNLIGTTANGMAALGNSSDGVRIVNASGNTVGGTTPAGRNVISANGDDGVELIGTQATGNTIQGNYIGLDEAGTGNLGNTDNGVSIVQGASDNLVGGPADGAANSIAFNEDGVDVRDDNTLRNRIQQNSIFNNTDIGIDLIGGSTTINDAVDVDEGPNRLQNFPVFVGDATLLGNSIAFRYRVPTAVGNATYPLTVEFFVADSANQEGQSFLASDTYTAAEAGFTKIVVVPAPPILTNNSFVATATDDEGNTSEFSLPVQISLPTILGSEPTVILPNEFININQVNRYQYISHSTGKTVFRIDFLHALGDLALEVRDEDGNLLAMSDTSSPDQNFEQVILPTVTQELYFINVIAVDFTDDFGQNYALEVENFPAPVPTGVHLDPASDTGMMNNDGVTNDTTPTFFIQTDVLNFVDTNNDGFYFDPDFVGPPAPPIEGHDAIHVLTADEAQAIVDGTPEENDEDGGIAVEITLVNTTTGEFFTFFADPVIPAFPEVYQFTAPDDLADGVYLVTARTKIFDGQGDEEGEPDQAMGRSNASPPLWFTIDTEGPLGGTFDILASSDSGMFDNDNVTNKIQPAFVGFEAEPNTKVSVIAQRTDPFTGEPIDGGAIVGRGVVDSFGRWEVTVEPLVDGKYNFFYLLEDLAGNSSDMQGLTAIVTNDTDIAIPDAGAAVDSTIFISQADFPGLVGDQAMINQVIDVNVTINIDHNFTADLDIFLISPAGTEIQLSTDNGGAGLDYIDTTFDDVAAVSIVDGTAPFTGRFRPEEPLSTFAGESVFGTWRLRVQDDAAIVFGTILDWTLELHTPLMVVIDTEAPNTPFLDLAFEEKDITSNNMPTVTMTTTDPNINLAQLLWNDNLKFRIYDRFENTAEFLLYDSALDTNVDDENVSGDMFTALTLIEEMPPQQFFDQVGTNEAVIEVNGIGKLADGMHNLKLEVEDRAGNISHDFLLKITVDTRPQLGVWAAGSVQVGGVGQLDGHKHDHANTFRIGTDLDYIFAGKFHLQNVYEMVGEDDGVFVQHPSGYDTLAAFGRIYDGGAFRYRWLVDINGNGYIDPATEIFFEPAGANITGYPVAGNFDGDATNGDEVGLFDGRFWYFDTDHDFNVADETPVEAFDYTGFPIAGDFDGDEFNGQEALVNAFIDVDNDGDDDVATYIATTSGGNLFSVDINNAGPGNPIAIDGMADYSFHVGPSFAAGIGFAGTRERPIAADFNGDGIDDFGLWVPDGINPVPDELSEWFILVSGDDPSTAEFEESVLDRILGGNINGFVPFAPGPAGNDIYAQFGNTFSLPVVGQFPPPGALNFVVNGMVPNDVPVEVVQVVDEPANEPVATVQQTPQTPTQSESTEEKQPEVVVQQVEIDVPPVAAVSEPIANEPTETSPVEPTTLAATPDPVDRVAEKTTENKPEPTSAVATEPTDPVETVSETVLDSSTVVADETNAAEKVAREHSATTPAEDAPVAPVETNVQSRNRSRSRSRSLSFGFGLKVKKSSPPVVEVPEAKQVAATEEPAVPATPVEEPVAAITTEPVVATIETTRIEAVVAEPTPEELAPVVIDTESIPTERVDPVEAPLVVDSLLETLTDLELSKPDLEPAQELVEEVVEEQVQAEQAAADSGTTTRSRGGRIRSLAFANWF